MGQDTAERDKKMRASQCTDLTYEEQVELQKAWDSQCEGHCCVLHGCKYGHDDCVVVTQKSKQDSRCERCWEEGIKKIPNPKAQNYDLLKMGERELRRGLIKARAEIKRLKKKLEERNENQ